MRARVCRPESRPHPEGVRSERVVARWDQLALGLDALGEARPRAHPLDQLRQRRPSGRIDVSPGELDVDDLGDEPDVRDAEAVAHQGLAVAERIPEGAEAGSAGRSHSHYLRFACRPSPRSGFVPSLESPMISQFDDYLIHLEAPADGTVCA